ncbi:MAG: type II/IV secretion system protein [Verrucomicrobia bacterium]|nr:type II/IV secretion system protein [Verrucomicrobiota bacterium]
MDNASAQNQHADVADILLAKGVLNESSLEQARQRQHRLKVSCSKAILDLRLASEEETLKALAESEYLEFLDLDQYEPSSVLLHSLPVKLVFHYQVLPVTVEDDCLTLAFGDVPSPIELGNLRLILGKRIKVVLATPSRIQSVIKLCFGIGADTVEQLRTDSQIPDLDQEIVYDVSLGRDSQLKDGTISRLVDQILAEALRLRATDVHIEPYQDSIRLRYRIDGILQKVPVPDQLKQLYGAIVSRLKIMADLNIAEKRLPHDGRITMKTKGEQFDLRVSVIPTKHGETICLRILGRESLFLDLSQLGMKAEQEKLFSEMVNLPQGLVLITGPTGSGKTTSLYAALSRANEDGRKIITIEDPVEYQIEGISQIQTREDIGLTFAGGLRSILRHDPDVVLVGEIRDHDTAEIAVRAAQTGHLVLSTLHTNDSIGAVSRLLGMGMDSHVIGSSLVASVAQRLARRICENCRVLDEWTDEDLRQEMAKALSLSSYEVKVWKGGGCEQCGGQGYRGRIAIYEFFLMNDELAEAIAQGITVTRLKEEARRFGWQSLRDHAFQKIQDGVIGLDELKRVTWRLQGEMG